MLTQLHFRGRVFLALVLFGLTGVSALRGQAVNGTISGTVPYPSGAVIAGASIQVKNAATQVVGALVETKQLEDPPLNGRHTQLITLAPGTQQMTPVAPGFFGTGEDHSVSAARPEGQPDIGSDRASGRDVFGVA
jgi:hypothetical protein